ncbi:MAG: serine protease, partial [Verrucomicrobiales bacterium]
MKILLHFIFCGQIALIVLGAILYAEETSQVPVKVPSEKNVAVPPPRPPDPLLEIAAQAVTGDKFLDHLTIVEQIRNPQPGPVTLMSENSEVLSSKLIAQMARKAHLRAGWYYRCTKCEKWHLKMAGAYAIAGDVVVTAHHVLATPDSLREGWFIVTDEQNKLYPTKTLLGTDETADTAIIRVSGEGLVPLPLAAEVEQGEAAYCFSDPLGNRGYFSDGIVNRLFFPDATQKPTSQVMNVSTDWAQGSSGSAIL